MKHKFCFLLFVFTVFLSVSCDSGVKLNNPNDPNNRISQGMGESGKECYPNNTCNKGLVCDEETSTCIKDPENADEDKTDTASENDDEDQTDTMSGNDGDKTDTVSTNDEDQTDTMSNNDEDQTDTVPENNDEDSDSTDTAPDNDSDNTDSEPDNDSASEPTDMNPCEPNPCISIENSTGICTATGDTTYSCTCETGYTGSTCNTCADGYFPSGGSCIKECDTNKCFKTHECSGTSSLGIEMTGTITGHGTCSNTTGECICDPGWKTGTSDLGQGTTVQCGALVTVFETLNNVECAICDKNNPPSQYASTGCPQELAGDDEASWCSSIYSWSFCGTGGSCYYEPAGSHQLYCVCESGYHLDNGDKYTGYCVEDETPDE